MNVPIFGVYKEGVSYRDRTAAYAVVLGEAKTVAVVRGPSDRYWLPGGGSRPGEPAETTIAREVFEEIGRGVQLFQRLGGALQFFHAAEEDCHYRMTATFFLAEFTAVFPTATEHELCWLPLSQISTAFFHDCHCWAVTQAMKMRID